MKRRGTSRAVQALVAVAICIAVVQFGLARFGSQSSWKGGGFGMYTEPHPQNRKVWAVLSSGGRDYPVLLWPVTEALRDPHRDLPAEVTAPLQAAVDAAYEVSTSARAGASAELARIAGEIDWTLGEHGAPVLAGGRDLPVDAVRVEVHELHYDIADRRIRTREIDAGHR